jgi:PAS domain-containing protein
MIFDGFERSDPTDWSIGSGELRTHASICGSCGRESSGTAAKPQALPFDPGRTSPRGPVLPTLDVHGYHTGIVINDESLDFPATALDSPAGPVLPVSRSGSIDFVNHQAEQGLGYRADELIGQAVEVLVPEGMESNWIQTVPGKGWFVILRMYGPLRPWLEQTWRPSEVELVK